VYFKCGEVLDIGISGGYTEEQAF